MSVSQNVVVLIIPKHTVLLLRFTASLASGQYKNPNKKPPQQPPIISLSQKSMAGRFKELLKKYGKVAVGVHCSVSAASITGLYIAIKNNVDVESVIDNWHLPGVSKPTEQQHPPPSSSSSQDGSIVEINNDNGNESTVIEEEKKKRNLTAGLAASGGALTLAVLCNKALFPIRLPITIVLTPPVARFLARRRILKKGV